MVVGFLWLRQIVEPDPEARIFAVHTDIGSRPRVVLVAGIVLGVIAIALIWSLKG